MSAEIREYIEQARNHRIPDDQIRRNLLAVGWNADLVEGVFNELRAAEEVTVRPIEDIVSPSASTSTPGPGIITTPPLQPKVKKSGAVWWVWLAVLCAGIAAGVFVLFKISASPSRIFSKFSTRNADRLYQSTFHLSYFDEGSDTADTNLGLNLKNINLTFSGKSAVDKQNPDSPLSSNELTYTLGSGGTSFTTTMKIRQIGDDWYLNIGDNPLFNSFFGAVGTQTDWLHVNLKNAEKPHDGNKLYTYLSSQAFKSKMGEIWQLNEIIGEHAYLGTERVQGTMSYHYSLTVNEGQVKKNIHETIDDIARIDAENFDSRSDAQVKAILDSMIDRMEVKQLEVWIGIRDARLYKIKMAINAPSLASLATLSSSELNGLYGRGDSKRLADLRQLGTALELYFNTHKSYPKDLSELSPAFIGQIPAAPPAEGICSDAAARYTYVISQPSRYALYSCFGKAVAGYKAGMVILSPTGFEHLASCPDSIPGCMLLQARTDDSLQQAIQSVMAKLQFSAEIKFESEFSDYGKPVIIETPAGAKELKDLMGGEAGIPDQEL